MDQDDDSFVECNFQIEISVLMLGETRCGKSSLIRAFLGENFMYNHPPSAGVDTRNRIIKLEEDGIVVKMRLLDAGCRSTYETVVNSYYREADCYVIVFDVQKRDTFEKVQNWLDSIVDKGGNMEKKLFVVIGNKTDGKQRVPLSEVEKFCDDNSQKPLLFMTSCKTGDNVEDAFNDIAEECVRRGLGKDKNNIRKSTLDMLSNPSASKEGEKGGCGCNLL
ncbi:ras-related protein Rab-13-like [Convolutriloba macropyga]|uniref:ras-related protein Rab-13-like n=1 Tax=Convolutriloba macropyga TaxID=536237 RepID=UPI003F51F793